MKRSTPFLMILLASGPAAQAATDMSVGDGLIRGDRLEPYELTWRQCAIGEEGWVSQGTVTERLDIIGNGVVRHRQSTMRPDGIVSRAETFLDHVSFAPLRIDAHVSKDGETVAARTLIFNDDGYTGVATRGDQSKLLAGLASRKMIHGAVMGLPLATIDYQEEPVRFAASMVSFDGTYDVTATWNGKETLEIGESNVEAWLIDVEWHHRESGDVYPPGPNGSGGRYWIVREPTEGVPHVLRYKTDTYAVEFTKGVCPDS